MDKPPGTAQLPPGPDPAAMAGRSALIAGVCGGSAVSKGLVCSKNTRVDENDEVFCEANTIVKVLTLSKILSVLVFCLRYLKSPGPQSKNLERINFWQASTSWSAGLMLTLDIFSNLASLMVAPWSSSSMRINKLLEPPAQMAEAFQTWQNKFV